MHILRSTHPEPDVMNTSPRRQDRAGWALAGAGVSCQPGAENRNSPPQIRLPIFSHPKGPSRLFTTWTEVGTGIMPYLPFAKTQIRLPIFSHPKGPSRLFTTWTEVGTGIMPYLPFAKTQFRGIYRGQPDYHVCLILPASHHSWALPDSVDNGATQSVTSQQKISPPLAYGRR